jgi:2,3,4,5-tetrahydropyridine-2-carboxylate N-succinyltransferase
VNTSSTQLHKAFKTRAMEVKMTDGYIAPAAWALGIATVNGDTVIDVAFPHVNLHDNLDSAAILFGAATWLGTGPFIIDDTALEEEVLPLCQSYEGDGDSHPNIDAIKTVVAVLHGRRSDYGRFYEAVLVRIDDLSKPAIDMLDVRLRLALLSLRLVEPNSISLSVDDIFPLLPVVAWTNHGPFLAEYLDKMRFEMLAAGKYLDVRSVDKFPPMANYVLGDKVRIADATRVRLGAYLSPGTTVMQEGFCNYNAGTYGPAMVEGRISQGVAVGKGTDIGGGVSILGTISGGNSFKVSIGEFCLLEAECIVGIPLGDRVRVEIGLPLKSTTPVHIRRKGEWTSDSVVGQVVYTRHYDWPAGWVKASELAGISDAVFRRDAFGAGIEVIPRGDSSWGKLTEALQAN